MNFFGSESESKEDAYRRGLNQSMNKRPRNNAILDYIICGSRQSPTLHRTGLLREEPETVKIIDFSPSGHDMKLHFEDDRLDSSDQLLEALPAGADHERERLAGGHLLPVVFRLDAADIDPALALLLGSGRGFSFGTPEQLEPLTDALCDWIWPSGARKPKTLEAAAGGKNDGTG